MANEYDDKDLGTQGQEDTLKGKMKQAAGKVQSAVGNATDNPKAKAKGDIKQAEGKAQETLGKGERKVDQAINTDPDR